VKGAKTRHLVVGARETAGAASNHADSLPKVGAGSGIIVNIRTKRQQLVVAGVAVVLAILDMVVVVDSEVQVIARLLAGTGVN
jgi:hypothetical protein